jgi:hypothetical protein
MKELSIRYAYIKVTTVQGRYVTSGHIAPFLAQLSKTHSVAQIGLSVAQRPIHVITLGTGPVRILMWSQMHGNESTTTKAVLDLCNAVQGNHPYFEEILNRCTIKIIPILNPDGALAYTRVNANGVDLNRDAQNLSQPESRVLRNLYDSFAPHYGFNLHGQRTIFSAGPHPFPATVSFLSPAFDVHRNLSPSRIKGMRVIAAMNALLQEVVPNQVGRYDDGFNADCVGDTFQMNDTVTLLFEAGHFQGDYEREKTRELIFLAMCRALMTISGGTMDAYSEADYFSIPENQKLFYDLLLRNVQVINPQLLPEQQVGLLYKEMVEDGQVVFIPTKEHMEWNAHQCYGHLELDCANAIDLKWLKNKNIPKLLL